MDLSRRRFFSILPAPLIVAYANIMPVKLLRPDPILIEAMDMPPGLVSSAEFFDQLNRRICEAMRIHGEPLSLTLRPGQQIAKVITTSYREGSPNSTRLTLHGRDVLRSMAGVVAPDEAIADV